MASLVGQSSCIGARWLASLGSAHRRTLTRSCAAHTWRDSAAGPVAPLNRTAATLTPTRLTTYRRGVPPIPPGEGPPMTENPQDTPSNMESGMIRAALQQAHRDKALAARLLGISQKELQRRMQLYGLTLEGSPEE